MPFILGCDRKTVSAGATAVTVVPCYVMVREGIESDSGMSYWSAIL